MPSAANSGWKTSEFWSMIVCNIVGFLLVKGIITQNEASIVTNQAPVIGALILFVVGNVGYMFTRLALKLRFGPMLHIPPPPTAFAQRSPTYDSTGTLPQLETIATTAEAI